MCGTSVSSLFDSATLEPIYEAFCDALRQLGVPVETGTFGAKMQVELVNDGPVTIILEV
jgi:D-aminoacyl-tRNA deacylase